MKTIFLKDDRLREVIVARNKKITEMLSKGKLRGSISIKLSTKKFKKNGVCFGWKIIDLENMRRETVQKKKIEPTGTITPQKDIFKFKSKNLGVFKKGG